MCLHRLYGALPFLALKHVVGSDQPIFYTLSQEKVADVTVEGAGATLTNTNCYETQQGWVLACDAP